MAIGVGGGRGGRERGFHSIPESELVTAAVLRVPLHAFGFGLLSLSCGELGIKGGAIAVEDQVKGVFGYGPPLATSKVE